MEPHYWTEYKHVVDEISIINVTLFNAVTKIGVCIQIFMR